MEPLDCGDHSCDFAKDKSGMRTNGGCRCLKPMGDVQRHKVKQHIKQLELQLSEAREIHDQLKTASLNLCRALTKEKDDALRLIDELKDKASVAAVILRQYVEGSGIPLERSVIARQLIETFETLTEKRNDECPTCKTRCCVEDKGNGKYRCDYCRTEFGTVK